MKFEKLYPRSKTWAPPTLRTLSLDDELVCKAAEKNPLFAAALRSVVARKP